MARVSIHYDSDIKERLFMIRGDESYARTTKILFEQGNVTEDTYHFDVLFNVNVLRDTGESSIIVYDNDTPISVWLYNSETHSYDTEVDVIPWDSLNNGLTFQVKGLAYDIDHNFSVSYRGNKSCIGSNSKNILLNVHDTSRPASTLTIDNTTLQYVKNTSITKTITLDTSYIDGRNFGQTINVYYDGSTTPIQVVTNNQGVATVTIPDCGGNGLHTIRAEYIGSDRLLGKTVTQQISVGYNVTLLSYPQIYLPGSEATFSAKVADWFGNPYTPNSGDCGLILRNSNNYQYHYSATASNGVISKTITPSDPFVKFSIGFSEGNVSYDVEQSVNYVAPTTARLYSYDKILSYNNNSQIIFESDVNVRGVPVVLKTYVNRELVETFQTYTSSTGNATLTYKGTGKYGKDIKCRFVAELGELTAELELPDYIQYLSRNPNYNLNRNIYYQNMDLLELTNAFQLKSNGQGQQLVGFKQVIPSHDVDNYDLIITGLNTNGESIRFYPVTNWTGGTSWSIDGNAALAQPAINCTNGRIHIFTIDDSIYFTVYDDSGGNAKEVLEFSKSDYQNFLKNPAFYHTGSKINFKSLEVWRHDYFVRTG